MVDTRYELGKLKEKFTTGLVWSLPRWVIYWALIRAWANATTGKYGDTSPSGIAMDEVVQRWKNASP